MGKQQGTLAVIAAILFAIAWIINATGIVTNPNFPPSRLVDAFDQVAGPLITKIT